MLTPKSLFVAFFAALGALAQSETGTNNGYYYSFWNAGTRCLYASMRAGLTMLQAVELSTMRMVTPARTASTGPTAVRSH